MKATHSLFFIYFLCVLPMTPVFSQSVNQDDKGESTLYLEGGNIGLDINQTEASITYNKTFLRIGRSERDTARNLIVGFTAKSKNETGIAGIFDNGKFVPGGSVSLRFGTVWNNKNVQRNTYQSQINEAVKEFRVSNNSLQNESDNVNKARMRVVKENNLDTIMERRKRLANYEDQIKYKRGIFFIEGGFNASGFTLREELGSVSTWGDMYKKENFVAPYLQAVMNFQAHGWFNGFSTGYAKANNLDDLSSDKLNYSEQENLGSGTVTRESSKEAYRRSEYKVFDKITFNYDLVKILPLPENKTKNNGLPQGYVAMNLLYIRYGMANYTGSLDLSKKENHKLNLGTGVHFFDNKGKFLGGVYVQLSDMANWDNKTKFGSKVSFGIVTRFNIEGLKIPQQKY